MRCKHCSSRLAIHDLWCSNCGHQTEVVRKDLSALESLKSTWKKFKPTKSSSAPAGAFVLLLGICPILIFLFALSSFGFLDLFANPSTGELLLNLAVLTVGMALLLPISMIPFDAVCGNDENKISLKALLTFFRSYPKYLMLSTLTSLYFLLIFIICFGLPNFGSDPILRLVWVVLVNYFLAILLPVPIIMHRHGYNAWASLKLAYKHFHVVRWQMYFMLLMLLVINAVAGILLLIPLLITIPLSWFVIRDYVDLILSYEIIRGNADRIEK